MTRNDTARIGIATGQMSSKLMIWLLVQAVLLPGLIAGAIGVTAMELSLFISDHHLLTGPDDNGFAILFLIGMAGSYIGLLMLPVAGGIAMPLLLVAFWHWRQTGPQPDQLTRRRVVYWFIATTLLSCAGAVIALDYLLPPQTPQSLSWHFLSFVLILPFGFGYSICAQELFWSALARRRMLPSGAARLLWLCRRRSPNP